MVQEAVNEQRDYEEQGKNDPADPPGNRRPAYMYRGLLLKLKKEQAGRGEDGAGEKESGAENQGNAVLRTLEADESDRGKHESQQTGGDLQIALQNGIRLEGDNAEPHGEEEKDDKPGDTRQDGS